MLTQPFWEVWSTPHCGRQLLLRWSAAGSRKPKITKRQSKKFANVVENAKVTLFLQAESLTSCKLLFRLIISLAIRLNWFTWIFFYIEQAPWKDHEYSSNHEYKTHNVSCHDLPWTSLSSLLPCLEELPPLFPSRQAFLFVYAPPSIIVLKFLHLVRKS